MFEIWTKKFQAFSSLQEKKKSSEKNFRFFFSRHPIISCNSSISFSYLRVFDISFVSRLKQSLRFFQHIFFDYFRQWRIYYLIMIVESKNYKNNFLKQKKLKLFKEFIFFRDHGTAERVTFFWFRPQTRFLAFLTRLFRLQEKDSSLKSIFWTRPILSKKFL